MCPKVLLLGIGLSLVIDMGGPLNVQAQQQAPEAAAWTRESLEKEMRAAIPEAQCDREVGLSGCTLTAGTIAMRAATITDTSGAPKDFSLFIYQTRQPISHPEYRQYRTVALRLLSKIAGLSPADINACFEAATAQLRSTRFCDFCREVRNRNRIFQCGAEQEGGLGAKVTQTNPF
jgi:hypothetical protein